MRVANPDLRPVLIHGGPAPDVAELAAGAHHRDHAAERGVGGSGGLAPVGAWT
jgi:hypothetical protein